MGILLWPEGVTTKALAITVVVVLEELEIASKRAERSNAPDVGIIFILSVVCWLEGRCNSLLVKQSQVEDAPIKENGGQRWICHFPSKSKSVSAFR